MNSNFGKVTHLTSDVTFRLNEISSREIISEYPNFLFIERINPRADTDIFRT